MTTTTVTSGIAVIGVPAEWPPRLRAIGRAQVTYPAPTAARATFARAAVTWRYLPGRRIKHALQVAATLTGHRTVALCGIGPAWYQPDTEQWWGTGSQAEYEHVAQVPECKRCKSRLAP